MMIHTDLFEFAYIPDWYGQLDELQQISSVLSGIKNFFTTIWTGIKNFFVGIWTAIYNSVSEKINLIKTVITVVWNAIHTAISTVLNAIWSVITTVWHYQNHGDLESQ